MGAWGAEAWENDGAADWFGDVMEATDLARYVEEALNLDLVDGHEEVRAAAHILVALGRVYVYPVDRLDAHLALAIKRLRQIIDERVYDDAPDFYAAVEREIEVLTSRLK
jgi:hypothetical protein